MTRPGLLAIAVVAACARPVVVPAETAITAGVTRTAGRLVVRATPRVGTRINALLPPILEFPDGRSERLVSLGLTPDSAYFLTPPEVTLPGDTPLAGSLIRASVCDSGAGVCRVVVLPL